MNVDCNVSFCVLEFQQHEVYHQKPSISKLMQQYFEKDIRTLPGVKADNLAPHIPCYEERKSSGLSMKNLIYILLLLCGTIGFFDAIGNREHDPFMSSRQRDMVMKCNTLIDHVVGMKKRTVNVEVSNHLETTFLNACAKDQIEIISNLAFEARNRNEQTMTCLSCRGSVIFNSLDHTEVPLRCVECEKTNSTLASMLKDNMLPIWKDRDGRIHYELPEPLKDLSLGEKLLIQKNSCLIPCYHLYKGTFGIKGHSVMFPKDFDNICNVLPRQQGEVLKICKQYKIPSSDHYSAQLFKVRKSVVIKALQWLNEHHPGYKDIVVNESNLNWIEEEEDVLISDDELDVDVDMASDKKEELETVAEDQTEFTEEDVDFYGVALQYSQNTYNKDSVELLKNIKDVKAGNGKKIPILDFPQVSEDPIDEFKSINVFADCYPW